MSRAQGTGNKPMVILADDRRRIQIRINGPDASGKNTSRQIQVLAVCVEQVEEYLLAKLKEVTDDH